MATGLPTYRTRKSTLSTSSFSSSPYRAGPFWKNDPYVRSMTNSVGNGIIADPSYVFQSVGYSTPAWNEMVIYELHVGSFLFDRNIPSKRGDFDTVIAKLGYLREGECRASRVASPRRSTGLAFRFGSGPGCTRW